MVKPAHTDATESLADLDDAALVAAAAAGRREAFDVIVERHRRTVYQVCYRFVNNHEDASDLAQDAFVRAWRGLKNFKGAVGAVDLALSHRGERLPQSRERQDAGDRADRVDGTISTTSASKARSMR